MVKSIFKFIPSITLKQALYFLIFCFLVLYIFSLPTFGAKPDVTHYIVYFPMSLLGILSLLYIVLFDKFKIPKTAFITPAFVLFTLLGTVTLSKNFQGFLSLFILTISLFVFLIAFGILGFKNVLIAISIAISIFSLVFIYFYRDRLTDISLLASGKLRLGFDFDNPNGIGAYEFLCFAASFYLLVNVKLKYHHLFVIPTLLSIVVGFSTGSKTFFFSIFLFVLIVVFFKVRRKWVFFLYLFIIICIGFGILQLSIFSTMKRRIYVSLGTIFGFGNEVDSSTIIRTVWLDYGFYIGARHILIGTGSNGFAIFSGLGTYAHSNYAELLCDFGIIGTLLFYFQLIAIFVKSLKVKSKNRTFVVAFVIYYLIVGLSTVFYYKKMYFLILAIMCGVVDCEPDSILVFDIKEIPNMFKHGFLTFKSAFLSKSKKASKLDLMYITNNPKIAKIAEKCGVDRIWIDLERLGKEERQKGLNTVKSNHTLSDVGMMRNVLTKSSLLVRVNPINPDSEAEINAVITNGADLIMLPMWKSVDDAKKFIDYVGGRAKTILLLETKEAVDCLNKVLELDGIDEIHIGLNDLHLSYKMSFMFELLSNGLVEFLCKQISKKHIKYGFGGVSHLGDGTLPADYIVPEHFRLGSSQVILSRGFCPIPFDPDSSVFEEQFSKNMNEFRLYEQEIQKWSKIRFLKNKIVLNRKIREVIKNDF